MPRRMSIRCALGVHRPLLNSIIARKGGFGAVCERCSAAIERSDGGKWRPSALLTPAADPS